MDSPTAPTINATGITAKTFAQIQTYLQTMYRGIYGFDAYLAPDSQDGQFIAVISQAIADCNDSVVASYNARSPATAQGEGLSSIVKINGLRRLVASYSTCVLTLTGQANARIANGQVVDINQNVWALPPLVTIGTNGTALAVATCTVLGAITAPNSAINKIQTPVYGWQSVTNQVPAIPGAPTEQDAALRARQGVSTTLPSVTIFEGIVAAIENVPGVTRARGYENNTAFVSAEGIPPGNLCFVVEGGAQAAIFSAMFAKITPGVPTLGTISQTMTDSKGSTRVLNYQPIVTAQLSAVLTIQQKNGWQAANEGLIAAALSAYVGALKIGDPISWTEFFPVAYIPDSAALGTFNIKGLTIQRNTDAPVSADIPLAYNEGPILPVVNVSFVYV